MPLATKKIIGSGSGCAGAPCEPKVKASAAAVPAKTKRTVLMAILLAPVPPRIGMLWATHSQETRSPAMPAAARWWRAATPGRAADEGDELAPSRVFNPWTDHGKEWTIAAPNAETILRFAVMEGDVLHPQSGKRMAGRNCCAAAAQGSSWHSRAMPQSITNMVGIEGARDQRQGLDYPSDSGCKSPRAK